MIEQELGLPWTQVFSSLSPCPVAAASLGQVYRGRLVSNNAEVAVKVGCGVDWATCGVQRHLFCSLPPWPWKLRLVANRLVGWPFLLSSVW